MTDSSLRTYFAILAIAMLLSLVAALTWRHDPAPPSDAAVLARWIEDHPSDWLAATDLTESALDSDLPHRFELWRAAHGHAVSLAPERANPRNAFVRSGFFHWYEIDDSDKRAVLAEAEPILRDPANLRAMAPAIYRLTGNFEYLKRVAGGDYSSLVTLRDLAVTNGLFDDYRALRDLAQRRRLAEFAAKSAAETSFDPTDDISDCTTSDQPLLVAILNQLHDAPLDKTPSNPPGVERLADYAIRHELQPLDGVDYAARDAAAPIRARLAIALGDVHRANLTETGSATETSPVWADYYDERAAYERAHGDVVMASAYAARAERTRKPLLDWQSRCGSDICTSVYKELVLAAPAAYSITLARGKSDEVPPYVELYVDDARVAEAAVARQQTFSTPVLAAGLHRIRIRVVNPFTRNLEQRRALFVRESP